MSRPTPVRIHSKGTSAVMVDCNAGKARFGCLQLGGGGHPLETIEDCAESAGQAVDPRQSPASYKEESSDSESPCPPFGRASSLGSPVRHWVRKKHGPPVKRLTRNTSNLLSAVLAVLLDET